MTEPEPEAAVALQRLQSLFPEEFVAAQQLALEQSIALDALDERER